ncbi:MAG: nitroreductase family deazaflavin-dependent oxidoreductase [Anaerolineales bacterium]
MSELSQIDRQEFTDALARFNKKVLNPFTLSFAGRPYSPYAIVQHVGRKSGRQYTTPVVARRTEEGFVIPLPYGEETDWHRNVQAAGEAVIASQGHAYHVAKPEVVDAAEGIKAYGPPVTWLLESADVQQYLRIRRVPDAPLGRAAYEQLIKEYPITRAVKVLGGAAALVAAAVLIIRLLKRRE